MALALDAFGEHCLRRYGPTYTLRMVGLGEVVIVCDPHDIRAVFTGDRDVMHAGEFNTNVGGQAFDAPTSVMLIDGDRHLRMRRLLLPPFHGEAVRRYAELVEEVAAAEVERWPLGEETALLPRMRAIALEVILRAVIGVRDEARAARLRALLPRVVHVSLYALALQVAYPRLAAGRIGRRLPWLRARRAVDEMLLEEIADHRAAPDGRDDILSLLVSARGEDGLGLSDRELRDQLFTLLAAGHETTASTLAWCFERLVRHPQTLARLRQEVDAGVEDAYLGAVVNETLRTRPVINAAGRRLTAPFELAGHRLPAGTTVAASIWGAHRLPANFAAAQEFRPERFLEAGAPPYAFIPFGGGTRRCIGAAFAQMEMKTILRTVLSRVELAPTETASEGQNRTRSMTVVPARGARVRVRARRPLSSTTRARRSPLARTA
jgi:cytochrome P450